MADGEMPAKEGSVRSLSVAVNRAGPSMAPVTGGAKVTAGSLSAAEFAQPTATTSDDAPVLVSDPGLRRDLRPPVLRALLRLPSRNPNP